MSDKATIKAIQMGVDHAAQTADATWGAGRLPMLVSDETRAKFLRQAARWRDALADAWNAKQPIPLPIEQAIRATGGGMQRAWAALEAEASERGHRPLSAVGTAPAVWETTLKDGTVVAVVRTPEEALLVPIDGRHVAVYSLEEIASVIDALGVLHLAKVEFPGAKVGGARRDFSWVKDGDEIPFG